MTSQELQKKLDAMKKDTEAKAKALRKEIAKQRRKEEREFTMEVGKISRRFFPHLKNPMEFEEYFQSLSANGQETQNSNDASQMMTSFDNGFVYSGRPQDPSESHQS